LAESARYPVDNPATHLELTMVHEAMILEYSGPYLAMLEIASAVKMTVLAVFFMGIVLPWGLVAAGTGLTALGIGVLAFIAKLVLAALVVAFIESTLVKMRFYRMQEYMATAYFFGLAGLVLRSLFS
jgi:formate hydrogenlyase subunit 4